MAEGNHENEPLEDRCKEAQLEKTYLEIENLKKENGWPKKLAVYLPLITAVLTVGGFLFGIYQFINEQRKERLAKEVEQILKIDNQILLNIEQILQFPGDKQQTISKVSFLLEDLKSLLLLKSNLEFTADTSKTVTSQDRNSIVSYSFINSIKEDCNFDHYRDVSYAILLIAQWEDLGRSLSEENSGEVEYILGKFTEAQKNVYDKDPAIIRNIRYLKDQNAFSYPKGYGKLNAAQLFHFQRIITGFQTYLEKLKDEKARERSLIRFQGAMCNSELMEQFFGVKYDPKIAPEEFIKCPKQ